MFGLYRTARAIVGPVTKVLYKIKVQGAENIPAEGPVIIASKHHALVDPIFHALCNKRILRSMAKHELFKGRFMNWLMRQVGAFPVRRGHSDRSAIDIAIEFLQEGQMVLIFPEGTRSRQNLDEFKSGAVMLAATTGTPIIPSTINTKRGYRPFTGMTVIYGKPVTAEELGARKGNSASLRKASASLRALVGNMLDEGTQ
jgi:1-acyl-sn-glycerol-3-phosphate acyltransferase